MIDRASTASSDVQRHAAPFPSTLLVEASALAGESLRETWRRESRTGSSIVALRGERREYVARIARDPGSDRRILANQAALVALHSVATAPTGFSAVIPSPVGQGMAAGALFTLETLCPGRTVDPEAESSPREQALAAAGAWITEFHEATERAGSLSPDRWERGVVPALVSVGRLASTIGQGKAFARFRAEIDAACLGRDLPVVMGHGNFWLGNVLFEPHPIVSGVVDWDLYEAESLPLLDLFHLYLRDDGIRRGGGLGPAVVRMDRSLKRGQPTEQSVEAYLGRIGVAPELSRSLLHLYWANHIAQHVRFDSAALSDQRWIERNVRIPLAHIASEAKLDDPARAPAADVGQLRAVTNEKKLRAYTLEAAIYDERRFTNPGQRIRILLQNETLIQQVKPTGGTRILDVATGTGVGALAVARNGASVVATDLTAAMLARLREKADAQDLKNIQLQVGSASELPYRDEAFDTVISLRFLHILPPVLQPLVVEEMTRVLRTGGTLAVTLNNPWHSFGRGYLRLLKAWMTRSRGNTGYLLPWQERALFRSVQVRKRIGIGPPGLGFLSSKNQGLALAYGRASRHFPLSLICGATLFVCEKRDRKP